VLYHLLAQGVEGRRIAVELHGEPLPDVVEALAMAGAEVVEVPCTGGSRRSTWRRWTG
jgi:uroporphyrinogen-III synthase